MTTKYQSYDAVVIGARCAGASTAMLLAQSGLRVLVADSDRYGTDTLSTHALMRGAILQLEHWGILKSIVAAGTPAVRTTAFYYGDEVIDIQIKPANGVDALYAPRRTVLDPLLVDAARGAGAEVVYQTRLVDLLRSSDGQVRGAVLQDSSGQQREIRARIVIGADGVRSTVARLVGAETAHEGRHSAATVFAFWSDVDVQGYHWHYRPGVAAGAIPTNDGMTILFVSVTDQRYRAEIVSAVSSGYDRLLKEGAPGLAAKAAHGYRESNFRRFSGVRGFLRRCSGPGWALVGDAGYFRDPLIAHGITDALRDAELLARAVVASSLSGDLAEYQAQRDDLSLDLFKISDQVASFDWTLDQLKEMHLQMSKCMNREVKALAHLHESERQEITSASAG